MADWIGNNIGAIVTVALAVIGLVASIAKMSLRLASVEEQLKRLVDVLVEQGKHTERMASIEQRIAAQGVRLDELTNRFNRVRNGEG